MQKEGGAILVVITGGPSVGKTTIVSLLQNRGFPVVAEQATQIIREGEFLPWVNRDVFQREVLRRQLEAEAPHLQSDEIVFLDRGLFDGEAYYLSDGMPVPEHFAALPAWRYSLALIIEELPFFDNNGVRFEDLDFTRRITPIIEKCYTSREIKTARVPALPPAERVDFVLRTVRSHAEIPSRRHRVPAMMSSLVYAR